MSPFRAYLIEQNADRRIAARFTTLNETDLDGGDVLIRVVCSSVNYKDALASSPQGQIVRRFPCVGGIDMAGVVVQSAAPRFRPGDAVIATSYDLGVSRHGGYAEYALVPGGWVIPMPDSLDFFSAMAIGTAGLTAAMAINRMEDNGLKPENGPVLVNGATGGVGSLAIDMLAGRGYEVHALTGKVEQAEWLRSLGAAKVRLRADLNLATIQPLGKGLWAGAIDNLGGNVLAWMLSTMKPTGVIASIGLAADAALNTSIMPFVLRGVSVLGIDSGYAGFAPRERAWQRLAGDLRPRHLDRIARMVEFDALPQVCADLLEGRGHGRSVVRIDSSWERT